MMDLHKAFQSEILNTFNEVATGSIYGTCSQPTNDKPLTIDILQDALQKVRLPSPQVMFSKHVPAMGKTRPTSTPLTDDMRKMVEDLGDQIAPTAWRINSEFGDVYFVNPVNMKGIAK